MTTPNPERREQVFQTWLDEHYGVRRLCLFQDPVALARASAEAMRRESFGAGYDSGYADGHAAGVQAERERIKLAYQHVLQRLETFTMGGVRRVALPHDAMRELRDAILYEDTTHPPASSATSEEGE